MKQILSYLIVALLLFVLFMIPTFFGVYEWQMALAITIGSVLADLVGSRIRKVLTSK